MDLTDHWPKGYILSFYGIIKFKPMPHICISCLNQMGVLLRFSPCLKWLKFFFGPCLNRLENIWTFYPYIHYFRPFFSGLLGKSSACAYLESPCNLLIYLLQCLHYSFSVFIHNYCKHIHYSFVGFFVIDIHCFIASWDSSNQAVSW